ncbi:hypothetical protein EGH82_22965 [Vibrio ponticus]|uniref:Uncharacterized protein n=1 Tax=Vibrio ponticus TaxID=265668 RepID=A0A3N3DSI2_9VIBR|nr:hypothetical protein [Vibrio ponticus]ROV57461.1 hypothetical protein EGH82_22965 [Vibrio ponticus]
MFRNIGLIGVACICLSAPAAASIQLDHLQPLDNQELASYRGGFLGEDFMINIGLDIATSVNGETLFNNRIANLFFQNGRLVADQPEVVPTTTVIQVGSGNSAVLIPSVEPALPDVPASSVDPAPIVETPQITVSQISAPLPSVTQTAINQVIQNSLDNTVLGFQTTLNIDAQVEGALRRIETSNKIQQSLQFNFN